MQITASNELVFSGADDQDALYEVQRLFRRNVPFSGISFDEYVLRLQDDLQSRTGLDDYVGPLSPEELQIRIAESELAHLALNGKATDANQEPTELGASMRKPAVWGDEDITYVLPPKWTPVILVGSIVLTGTFTTRRDDLLELMIDGTNEVQAALEQVDDEDDSGIAPLSPEENQQIALMMAQGNFDRVNHATKMLLTIARHFKPEE